MTQEEKDEILNTFKWIKVKKFNPNDYKTLEERYEALENHHVDETTFLIYKIREILKG